MAKYDGGDTVRFVRFIRFRFLGQNGQSVQNGQSGQNGKSGQNGQSGQNEPTKWENGDIQTVEI